MKINVPTSVKKVFSLLRVAPSVGGLEISDTALRFALWERGVWRLASVRLAPGVMAGGVIQDKDAFQKSLHELRIQILGAKAKHKRKKINAVISLSSVQIYTQIFNLPFIEGRNLEKAVQLNIQMASPGSAETYAGWQLVREEEGVRLEILSAFLDKAVVDVLTGILRSEGFSPVVIESSAFSLVRAFRERGEGFHPENPAILMHVGETGIGIMVVRHGHLHFDYFISWHDIQGEAQEISFEGFNAALLGNLQRVMNFYNAHWKEPVTEMVIVAPGMEDDVASLVQRTFSVPVRTLTLSISSAVSAEWLVAVGGGLRGMVARREDREISLLGIDAQEEYRREQALNFTDFWRVLMPSALGIMLAVLLGSDVFVRGLRADLEAELPRGRNQELAELASLEKEASDFNSLIASIKKANVAASRKSPLLGALFDITQKSRITISRLSIQGTGLPIGITAIGKSQEDVIAFKDALQKDARFQNVNLPITDIKKVPDGFYFSMNFSAAPSKAE